VPHGCQRSGEGWVGALLHEERERPEIKISEAVAIIHNGSIIAKVYPLGELSFVNIKTGIMLLRASHSCFVNPS